LGWRGAGVWGGLWLMTACNALFEIDDVSVRADTAGQPRLTAGGEGAGGAADRGAGGKGGGGEGGGRGGPAGASGSGPSGEAGNVGRQPLSEYAALAAGGNHACFRDQGVARCWGHNRYGQLGSSTNAGSGGPNPTPTLVEGGALEDVYQFALGGSHSCALRDDKYVFCWGYNNYGQLGNVANNGTATPNPVPTMVDGITSGLVRQVAAGGGHTCALRGDGRVLCWGYNVFGQVGRNAGNSNDEPNPTPTLVDDGRLAGVRQLALGQSHSCVRRDDGRVLCWGLNNYGQLGADTNKGSSAPNPTPLLVENVTLGVVRQLALGATHSCAVREDGRALCWGNNQVGQLGSGINNGTSSPTPAPTLIDDGALAGVRQLALGYGHSCALRDDGRVLCWGQNFYGQLGNSTNAGTTTPNPVPTLIDNAALEDVRQIALGTYHSCALRNDGRVLCWGYNGYGQLGSSASSGAVTPNPVPTPTQEPSPSLP
jgi:alpha-tubulin suppressor-like RCC1 family protein